jgi:rhodanese-related sulfurtransferase
MKPKKQLMGAHFSLAPDAVRDLLRSSPVLIDVRTDTEVARGLIPGALHIPLHLLPARLEEISRDRVVAIYCQSGVRSAQASHFLADNGWAQVYNLAGGFSAWLARAFPIAQKLAGNRIFGEDQSR